MVSASAQFSATDVSAIDVARPAWCATARLLFLVFVQGHCWRCADTTHPPLLLYGFSTVAGVRRCSGVQPCSSSLATSPTGQTLSWMSSTPEVSDSATHRLSPDGRWAADGHATAPRARGETPMPEQAAETLTLLRLAPIAWWDSLRLRPLLRTAPAPLPRVFILAGIPGR